MKKIILAAAFGWLRGLTAQVTLSAPANTYLQTGAYTRNFTDAFSGRVNQAALAGIKTPAAGIYSERRFMLKALSYYAVSVAWPSKKSGFGLNAGYFGNATFNSSSLGFAYGRQLRDNLNMGIQLNYHLLKVAGYGSSATVSAELGSLFYLPEKFCLGLHFFNPVGGKFGKTEKLPAVYTTGIGYEASANFFLAAEIIKEEDRPVDIRTGFQYHFARQFFARGGISMATGNYVVGIGLKWKGCRLDMVSGWDSRLGFTPALVLFFEAGPEKDNQE